MTKEAPTKLHTTNLFQSKAKINEIKMEHKQQVDQNVHAEAQVLQANRSSSTLLLTNALKQKVEAFHAGCIDSKFNGWEKRMGD